MSQETEKKPASRAREHFAAAWSRTREAGRSLLACNERNLRREVAMLTTLYFIILIWILCLKLGNTEMLATNYRNLSQMTLRERFLYDIVPFRTRQNHVLQWLEFFANAFMFAPFGVLFNFLFSKKNAWRDFFLCFALSLCIEVFQLFTLLGGFATVDLIMNSLGYFVGLGIYYLIFQKRSVKACVWICRVVNFIFLPVAVYALVTTLQNRELIGAILARTL